MTSKEKKTHVGDFIEKRAKKEAVTYQEVKKNVELKTKKRPALRTIKDYGKAFNITSKKRKRVLKSEGLFALFFLMLPVHCLLAAHTHYVRDRN